MERLNQVSWLQTQTLSGTGRSSQLLNLIGKIQTMAQQKQITVGGRTRKVSSMELADQDGSVVEIHVWDDAYEQVKNLRIGDGITIVGCSAQREADGQQVKSKLMGSSTCPAGRTHCAGFVTLGSAAHESHQAHGCVRAEWSFAPSCQRGIADVCGCLGQRA